MTHIDFIPIVSDEQVPQYPSLIQVSKGNHVLHSPDGGRVHRFDPPLWRQPLLLTIVINHLDPGPLGSGDYSGP